MPPEDDSIAGVPEPVQPPEAAVAPPRVFSRDELCDAAVTVAEANNLPVPFFTNLIQQESGFKPHVVSPAGAQGIAQFMPKVAAEYGLTNPFDPVHALIASGKFLRGLVAQFGNVGLAAAAYNAGSKRVENWLARRGKLPTETRHYVRNITGRPAEQWIHSKVKSAEPVTLPALSRCPGVHTAPTMEARAVRATASQIKVATAEPSLKLATAAPSLKVSAAPSFKVASAEPSFKLASMTLTPGRKTIVLGAAPSTRKVAAVARRHGHGGLGGVASIIRPEHRAGSSLHARNEPRRIAHPKPALPSIKLAGNSVGHKVAPSRQAASRKIKIATAR